MELIAEQPIYRDVTLEATATDFPFLFTSILNHTLRYTALAYFKVFSR